MRMSRLSMLPALLSGLEHLGKALKVNTGLKDLDLSKLALDDRGALYLAQACVCVACL